MLSATLSTQLSSAATVHAAPRSAPLVEGLAEVVLQALEVPVLEAPESPVTLFWFYRRREGAAAGSDVEIEFVRWYSCVVHTAHSSSFLKRKT